jgi:PAS domain S-box-containing protein
LALGTGKPVDVGPLDLAEANDVAQSLVKASQLLQERTAERERAEQRVTHLASFPELNRNPIIEIDLQGKITYANPAATAQFPDLAEIGTQHPILKECTLVIAALKADAQQPIIRREVEARGLVFQQTIHYFPDLEVVRIYVVDVTERKRAEEKLRESEGRLQVALEAAELGTWDLDLVNDLAVRSLRHDRIWGYTEAQPKWNLEIAMQSVVPEDRQSLVEAYERGIKSGVLSHESRIIWPDGSIHWILANGRFQYDDDGRPIRVVGVVADITDRKRAEESLRESEERLRLLGDNLPNSIVYQYTHEPDGTPRFLYVSAGVERLNGVKAKDVLKDAGVLHRQFLPQEMPALLAAEEISARTLTVFKRDMQMRLPDEQVRWMRLRSRPRRMPDGRVIWDGVQTDVTEHKLVEEALQRQADLLRLSFDAIIVWRFDGGIESWNRGAEQLYGYSESEALGRVTHELLRTIHPVPLPGIEATLRESRQWEGELRHVTKEGRELVVSARLQLILDANGVERVLETNRDITQHKLMEEELQISHERMGAIIGSAMDAIITISADQRILVFNTAAEKIFGCPAAEAIGSSLDRFIPVGFREAHRRHIQAFASSGKTSRSMYSPGILSGLRTNGEEFPLEATISQVTVGGEKLYTIILRDISQRKQTEEALIRSEKLATVGRMAATIAHEINNPLGAVTNLLFLANSVNDLPESARQYLEMADAELKRIGHITRQSLGFYRESNAPARTSVNAVLESAVDLLRGKIKAKHAVIEKQWNKDVEFTAVAGELRQVFSNLLANSLDAVDEEGTIKLRVSTGAALNGRRRVRVTVADNGKGIPTSARRHMFEPFFTTKGTVGTGLGLWVSKQIIDKHGGTIRMRSSSEGARRGTVFSIILPVEPAAAAHSQS